MVVIPQTARVGCAEEMEKPGQRQNRGSHKGQSDSEEETETLITGGKGGGKMMGAVGSKRIQAGIEMHTGARGGSRA